MASYRNGHCAKTEEEIKKSLEGNYKREHVFALKQALELDDFYDQQMQTCDQELASLYAECDPPDEPGTEPPYHTNARENAAKTSLPLTWHTLSFE